MIDTSRTETSISPGALTRHARDERGVDLFFERGRMRVSFPFGGAARVRFTPSDRFAPRRSWDVAPPEEEHSPVPFSVEEGGDGLLVEAGPLSVAVGRDGAVGFRDDRGEPFAVDLEPVSWGEARIGETVLRERQDDEWPEGRARLEMRVSKAIAPGEGLYGFGQRTGLLDRRGRVLTNWTIDPEGGHGRGHDNLYQAHPIFLGVRPALTWGAYLHTTWYSRVDAGAQEWERMEWVANGGELDYYLFLGPDPAGVVEKLTRLTGRPLMPPLWALGYHQSRWGYANQTDMRELADGFREHDMPLDVIHFDIDYMRGYRAFTWDPERFPDPKGLIAELRERGIRAVTIIDPGVKHDVGNGYAVADDGIERGYFISHPDGAPYVGYCWPDEALFPDFARADVRAWWSGLHEGYVDNGVAGIWNDMNEPAIFDRPFSEGYSRQRPMPLATPQGEGEERTVHAEVHNLYGLLMDRATWEGLRELRPGERPWVLTRSGYTGVQRYAAAWMGDNNSWWEHLEVSLPMLSSMAISGVPHVGVDIGGFFGNTNPELFARWVLMGTFYPFMRTHSSMGSTRQEPWSLGPEVTEIAREAIRLRYKLLPYLYTLAHEAHRTGAPILRPLLYDFPDDAGTYQLHDQVMFGPHMMVAPILHPSRQHRIVYLPAGQWYDYWTGKSFDGPLPVVAPAPLSRIPVFVRGGAVLPLGNVRASTNEPLAELTLDIYPSGESAYTWTEDDGHSTAYERGEVSETTVRVAESEGRITLRLEARSGPFQPHPRALAVRVHTGSRPASVALDDSPAEGWTWDEERGALGLRWEDDGSAHEVVVALP